VLSPLCPHHLVSYPPFFPHCAEKNTVLGSSYGIHSGRKIEEKRIATIAAVGDPDATMDDEQNNELPSIPMRVFASLFYLIPWIDICSIGKCFAPSNPKANKGERGRPAGGQSRQVVQLFLTPPTTSL